MARRYDNPLKVRFAKEFFSRIPCAPGVYFMKSKRGEVLYIGKAKSLRHRVRSYAHAKPGKVGTNIIRMIERVRSIEWEPHESEQIAFQRELELIRAFVPRYNIENAWEENYFFIGLRGPVKGKIEFRLTRFADKAPDYELHGCYPRQVTVRNGYAALLRILFACAHDQGRFSFPAKLARPSPAYNYSLKIADPEQWLARISAFLHGNRSDLLHCLVERLLANVGVPEYVRPGLQRDIYTLRTFEKACLEARRAGRGTGRQALTHSELREMLKSTVAAVAG